MALPNEPGVYRDVRGDEWVLHEDRSWQWTARRMTDGRMWPVADHPGMDAEALAALGRVPGAEVLPLQRVKVGEMNEVWFRN
ncbi:hypothetical protein OHB12_22935 [Nocardia sp. NBC_01730]|uniref:hypothetical protein n=1 Tax=Nocardia sp. NBC_01730 TaxID=2975998 RepID=UPI002E11576C|nr:hypothetical protein OHB12_22935 [Nocardia sp. NBC_01730]